MIIGLQTYSKFLNEFIYFNKIIKYQYKFIFKTMKIYI